VADDGHVALALEVEAELLSGLLCDPGKLDAALEVCAPHDLQDPRHQALFRGLCEYLEHTTPGEPADVVSLCEKMSTNGALEKAGGPAYIAEVMDYAATGEVVVPRARLVRRKRIEREMALLAETLPKLLTTPDLRPALDTLDRLRMELEDAAPLDLAVLGFAGERLRALREREDPASPLPGLLDPEPHLHMLSGRPKSGKTTLSLKVARDWCLGVKPWPGAPELPGTRALVISREQTAKRLDAVLLRLSVFADRDGRETWTERLPIVARDAQLPREARAMLTLDSSGLATLRRGLTHAREIGDPYGLVVLDSLSRLKPPGVDEDKSDSMAPWLDQIEDIAVGAGVYVLLIHHQGHTSDPARSEARSAGRGSSAIQAVAHGAWLLERVPADPRQRLLKVDGNNVLAHELTLEVCGETAEPGTVHYFRPVDPLDSLDIDDFIPPGGQATTSAIAWGVMGQDPDPEKRPSGPAQKTAGGLMSRWERDGLGETTRGPRGSRVFHRNLAGPGNGLAGPENA
jgi:replicative DNA helicase